ncbi:MAG: SPASM domain-containing protein [Oscillospiraceae bacterium]|nr:SPASM domain-containing protein [Oscillospiraceae bacterium]
MSILEKVREAERGFKEYLRSASECKEMYIYGAGNYAKALYKFCKKNNIKISAFCVTNAASNIKYIENVPVITLSEIDSKPSECCFVIAMKSSFAEEVKQLLKDSGYNNHSMLPKLSEFFLDIENNAGRYIEVTLRTGCSVNCKYCPQEQFISSYSLFGGERVMKFDTFINCLEHIAKDVQLVFSGFAEPFLNPSAADMMCYAHKQGYKMSLFTTLVGMREEDFEKIKQIPFVNVVLHLPDNIGYANIPITDEYYSLLDKILDTYKVDGSRFVTTSNCQGVPADGILEFINNRTNYYSEIHDRAGMLDNEGIKTTSFIEGAIVCQKSLMLNNNVLLPDGTVVLCCMDFGMKHILGNLLEKDYDDLSSTPAKAELIKRMENGGDVLCRKCIYALKI